MKMLQKLQKRLQNGKKDNKGFSLVELIIVIAIMAILVGIVGTQVIPYLNKSREAKDNQILDAFSTAAVSAYSMNAENDLFAEEQANAAAGSGNTKVIINMASASNDWSDAIWALTSYEKVTDTNTPHGDDTVAKAMSSSVGKSITDIVITIDFATNELTVQAKDSTGDILEKVTSHI